MYERLTDRARKVLVLANQEAQRFNHEYIGTEHILLGLVREGSGVASNVLRYFDVDLRKIRMEVEKLVQSGPDMVTMGRLPQTPRAKKVIEYAIEESGKLGREYIGTEHILLGLLREQEGVAAQVLMNLGLQLDAVREYTLALTSTGHVAPEPVGVGRFRKFIQRLFGRPGDHTFLQPPRISKPSSAAASLVAVDIGNSRMKLGRFVRDETQPTANKHLPEPNATIELPIVHKAGLFDLQQLAKWCEEHLSPDTHWVIGTVHQGAGQLLTKTIAFWAQSLGIDWRPRLLTYSDLPLVIRVDEPARVGIDRLLAAVAANRLRQPERAAIIVDLGTAITVDLIEADGAFAGGAILPGVGMAGRALAEQTDALPHVVLEHSEQPPTPLGKSTRAAIEAGLYWGTVGAVGEIASRLAAGLSTEPDFFITGGASRTFADSMDGKVRVQYVPHLVMAGIAIVEGMKDKG